MEYFELRTPVGNGRCMDESCPCSGSMIPRGEGYLCITPECAEFRRATPDVRDLVKKKVMGDWKHLKPEDLGEEMDGLMRSIYRPGVGIPILMCELAAKRKGLDLEVAAADAHHWWRTEQVPLRPTPLAKEAPSNLYCPHCGGEVKRGAEFCLQCGGELPTEIRESAAPTQAPTPSDPAGQLICDICAAKLDPGDQRIVSPSGMRIIAGNHYGRNIILWGQIPPEERDTKFYQLTLMNDTPWGLCPSCYDKTRAYAEDKEGGLSHDDFREFVMKPLWEAAGIDVKAAPSPRPPAPAAAAPADSHRNQQSRKKGGSLRAGFLLIAILILSAGGMLLYLRARPPQPKQPAGDAQAFFDQGVNLTKTRKYAEAAQAFEKAIELNPKSAEARNELGFVYLKLRRGNDAVESLKKAIDVKPDDPTLHRNLGEIYRLLGRWREAIASYRKAVSLKPDYAAAYNEMGLVYRKMRDHSNAIDAYKQALLIKSDYTQAHYGLGLAYLDINDQASANQEYEALQKLNRRDLAKKLKTWIRTEEPVSSPEESTNQQP